MTPGRNETHYVAGAIHVRTKRMTWVTLERKAPTLLISTPWRLASRRRRCRVFRGILEDCVIRKSGISRRAVAASGGKVGRRILPPCRPDDAPVALAREDSHANVARNHCCRSTGEPTANAERLPAKHTRGLGPARAREAA